MSRTISWGWQVVQDNLGDITIYGVGRREPRYDHMSSFSPFLQMNTIEMGSRSRAGQTVNSVLKIVTFAILYEVIVS